MTAEEAAGLLFMLAGLDVEPARILTDAATRARVVEAARVNRSELRGIIGQADGWQRRDGEPATVSHRLSGVLAMLDRLEEAVETVETAAAVRT